jgi:hypothetical protein
MEHSRQVILALQMFHRLRKNHFSIVMQKYMLWPKIGRRKITII